jgi:hypothetical protein
MDMIDILVLFQAFLLGWVCHAFYMAYKMRKIIKKIAEDNDLTMDELNSVIDGSHKDQSNIKIINVPNLFTETAGNSIMLYSKDTGSFMCQATTVEDLADNLYKFNKVKFALVQHDSKEVWFVEGKVKDNLKDLE